jgi:hypothetical protein
MKKKSSQRVWVYKPQPPKFKPNEKAQFLEKVKTEIKSMPKLSQKISRVDMRANRIYLYELVEQFKPEGAEFILPLIDDKYLEFPYARITLKDKQGEKSTVDWQRHNNQWMELFEGTLLECLSHVEADDEWIQ